MPSISVIIPVHNVENHVEACIASVQRQTMTDFEAIVVDDGSTDHSAKILRKAIDGDRRFQIVSQENRGLGAARNAGLDLARGEYIAFLDGDDRYAPGCLFQLYRALEESGADWVACGVRYCSSDGSEVDHSAIHGLAGLHSSGRCTRWDFTDWNRVIRHFPSAWNKLYRRDLIKGLRFEKSTWFEDHGFFYRAAARTDHLMHLAQPLYLQTRGRDGQITASDDDRVFDQFPVLDDMYAVLTSSGRNGAVEAFEKITSRLLFERSTALRHPDRRARFAAISAQYFADRGLQFKPVWDPHIARSWGVEMRGELPLSIIIPWSGKQGALLSASLDALARPAMPGHEVLVVCDTPEVADLARTICQHHPQTRVLTHASRGSGPARNAGLAEARGHYVCLLDAGYLPDGTAMQERVDSMIRTGAEISVSAYREDRFGTPVQSGFFPPGPPHDISHRAHVSGLTPEEALQVEPQISTILFDRRFLDKHGICFGTGALPTWQVVLKAALGASKALYHSQPCNLAPEDAKQSLRPAIGAGLIIRALDELATSITEKQANGLPDGWYRRLFTRALRQEMNRLHRPGGKPGKVLFTLSALGFALRHRLTVERTPLDPLTGPRLETLMSVEAILRKLPDTDAPNLRTTPDRRPLNTTHGARVRFQADFLHHSYVNIFFYDVDGIGIPFHLSLRRDQGVAVCNNRIGPGWGNEITKRHSLSNDRTEVEIVLQPHEASVVIDGHRMFHFRNRHPFARFSRLARISSFEVQGGVVHESLQLEMFEQDVPKQNQMYLNDKLELVAKLAEEPDKAPIRLDIAGTDMQLEAVTQRCDKGCEVSVVLPGRVWQQIETNARIDAGLITANGAEACPRMHLDRADMACKIETILSHGPLFEDPLAAMQIIEHVRFGGLIDRLSNGARANLQETVGFFGLHSYLVTGTKPALPPDTLPKVVVDPVITATTRFNQRLSEDTDADPMEVLLWAIEDQPKEIRREVFLGLGDFFCFAERDFEAFHALFVTDGHGVDPLPGSDDVSRITQILPFLLHDGRIDDLKRLLWSLENPGEHWISSPSLACMLRQTVLTDTLSETDREALLYGVLKAVSKMSEHYWSRSHCSALIDAVVEVLGHCDQMASYLARDIESHALRAYALSPRFWQALDNNEVKSYGLDLERARSAFDTIHPKLQSGVELPNLLAALDTLDSLGCYDAQRVRRELTDPQDTRSRSRQTQRDTSDSTWQNAEELIRDLAFPASPPPASDAARRAEKALPWFYPHIAQAPYLDLQIETCRAIETLLADATSNPVTPAQISELAPQLRRLAGQRSEFLGIGLILSLLRNLANDPRQEMAVTALSELLRAITATLDQTGRKALRQAALPRLALQALRDTEIDQTIYQSLTDNLADLTESLPVPVRMPQHALGPVGAAPYDTIVMVFSCKANLGTRIPALRESWLQLLKEMEIPYLVVVGNGDGSVEGDVLHLDAPDDYEGLPQKTLATIRWVHDNTNALHMAKIDDDCFLNPHVFFRSLSYRKFDYYGRILTRHPGQMDRAWHNAKSTSARGKLELDKSPEPSTYTDGGSGYALSRSAMAAVLDAMQSPDGQQLQQLSFMEDKLLGDLLALRGIKPSQQDYRVSLRRRTHADGQPVARWVNSFFASRATPVSLVHLDDHASQPLAMDLLDSAELYPKKIWPSFQDATLGYQSNALELVSDESRIELARTADIAVVSCTRNEMFLLPHFLNHYRGLGAKCFLIADNCSDDGTLEYLMEQPDVVLFSVDTDYSLSQYGVAWQQAMLSAFRVGKWSVVADTDELLVWEHPAERSLETLLHSPEFRDADAARMFMLDMYPKGELAEATFRSDPFAEAGYVDQNPFLVNAVSRGPFCNMPTWTSALRHRLIPGSRPDLFVAQKIALLRYKPWMRLSAGLHYVSGARLASRDLLFAHFKYNADFHRKVNEEVSRTQHFNEAEEYRKYLQVLSEGRDVVFEDCISVPWTEAPFVKSLLKR